MVGRGCLGGKSTSDDATKGFGEQEVESENDFEFLPKLIKAVKHRMFAYHPERNPSISQDHRPASSQASTRNLHFSPAMISTLPSAGFHSAPPSASATISSKSPTI